MISVNNVARVIIVWVNNIPYVPTISTRRKRVRVSIQKRNNKRFVFVNLKRLLFDNLADNAIKACAAGGRVVLRCVGNSASVEDNGKGMTEEELLHITEPFYRTDKSRSRAEGGAGLGLALCKNIAEAHGAKLRFESEIGKGTIVFLQLDDNLKIS